MATTMVSTTDSDTHGTYGYYAVCTGRKKEPPQDVVEPELQEKATNTSIGDKDPCGGITCAKPHFLRIINTLNYDEKTMEVCNETTISQLQDFYEIYNTNCRNYVWKDIWGNTLELDKSLEENGFPDNSAITDETGLDHFPTILLYFKDGFEDEPKMVLDLSANVAFINVDGLVPPKGFVPIERTEPTGECSSQDALATRSHGHDKHYPVWPEYATKRLHTHETTTAAGIPLSKDGEPLGYFDCMGSYHQVINTEGGRGYGQGVLDDHDLKHSQGDRDTNADAGDHDQHLKSVGDKFGAQRKTDTGGASRKSREGEPGRTHDDFVPPEFIPIEEIGPVYPFPPSSHYELTTVPVFPDLEKDGPTGIPPGAKAGYMDQDGVFHEANSGDILPSNGATIGYMDNDGTYHEVMGIEDGVNNGQLASREGYQIIRDHAHPEEAGHDGEGVSGGTGAGAHGPGAGAMGGKQAHGRPGAGASHAGASGTAGAEGHDGRLGHSGSAAGVVHMSSVSMSVRPKESPTLDQLDANLGGRYGAEGPRAGSKSGRDGGQDGGLTGQDLKQAAPNGGAGGAVGYMGKDGDFVEVKSKEVIPANAKPAYKDLKSGKTQELHPPPKSMAGAGGQLTGQDLKNAAPGNGAVGYIDKDGKFVELGPNDLLPAGAKAMYKDPKTGKLQELHPPPKSMAGAGGQLTGQDLKNAAPGNGAVGYIDKDGKFVELGPNDLLPPGAKAMYKDPKTGKLQELHPPPKSMAGAGGPLTGHDLKQAAPDGGAGGAVGYIGKDGQFVELGSQETIPANAKPVYKDLKTGKTVDLIPPTKGGAGAGGPLTGHDLKQAVPDGDAGGAAGYIGKDGQFVELGSQETIPANAKPVYKDLKTGKTVDLIPPTKGGAGAGGPLTGHDLKQAVPDGDAGGAAGYIGKDGQFVELGSQETIPANAKPVYKDLKTGKTQELHPPPKSMAGAGGPPTGQDLKQAAPGGGAGGAVGYMGKDGGFVEVKPNEVLPANAKPVYKDLKSGKTVDLIPPTKGGAGADGQLTGQDLKNAAPGNGAVGYIDKNGKFVELGPNDLLPPGAKAMYKDPKTGKLQELHPPPKSMAGAGGPLTGHDLKQAAPDGGAGGAVGYMGKDGGFVEVKPNEVIPANAKLVYKDLETGKMVDLIPPTKGGAGAGGQLTGQDLRNAAPGNGAVGYIDKDGKFVELGPNDLLPPGAKAMYKDPKTGKLQELTLQPILPEGSERELRESPLTEEELKRLKEFQRHIAVQVELEFVEGSLDLGEVVRNSFRIYSHGASVDIRKSMAFRDRTLDQEGEKNRKEEEGASGTPAKQKKPTTKPGPK